MSVRGLLLVVAAAVGSAGAAPPGDGLAGVRTRAELEQLVARLRSGEVEGAQSVFEREGGPYRVYTSYIEARKGAADIHAADDEIYVVLSGSASLTLGGDIVDERLERENEYRGTEIAGGVTQRVAAGDIASAPRGTAHQMDPGEGHVLYLVIKILGAP